MKELPKISIVVPVYNVEEYVAECIQSVMRQTYRGEMECIIVDGGGPDNSMSIVEELIVKYSGPIVFRVIHDDRNRGVSGSRNNGTDAATGDYIFYIDSDDFISNDCIELLAAPLREREYDMVIGNFENFRGERVSFHNPAERLVSGQKNIMSEVCEELLYVMPWNKLVSLKLIRRENVQFIERILHEDVAWSFEIGTFFNSVYVVDAVTYYYRIRNNSLAVVDKSKKSDREYSSYMQVLNRIFEIANKRGIQGEEFDAFINSLLSKALYVGVENDIDISNDYKQFRKLYKRPCGLNILLHDPKAFKRRMHWYLPFGIADRFLKWKFNRRKLK